MDDAHMRGVPALLAVLGIAHIGRAISAPLELEYKIELGAVSGRIDHLAIDLKHRRLYVAELGNDSVGVVDLGTHKLLRTLQRLKEPQGIGYVPATDTLYVASAGDGSLKFFQGAELAPIGEIALGHDADNVRVDDVHHRLYVGYGEGALAVIDTDTRQKIADIALKGHPESFQLDPSSGRIVVNVPDASEVAIVDRGTNKQLTSWPMKRLAANFPLALDEAHKRVIVIFRRPSTLGIFRSDDGQLITQAATCADADDTFLDASRNRIYVTCGEGVVDVFETQGNGYSRAARIPTSLGARTGLFVSQLDRLFLAVRSTTLSPAAIWVIRPAN
jgi:DNA-binding beta-propeller fold protein YncE